MSFEFLQLLLIERAESVDLTCVRAIVRVLLPSMPPVSRGISLNFWMPDRILVFTVPKGSANRSAISVCVKPSK